MSRRIHHLVAGIAVVVLAVAMPAPVAAAASPSLAGQLLYYSNTTDFHPAPPRDTSVGEMTSVHYYEDECEMSGGSFWYVTTVGNANGSMPGTFEVTFDGDSGENFPPLMQIRFLIWGLDGSLAADGIFGYMPNVTEPVGEPPYLACSRESPYVITGHGRFRYTANLYVGATTTVEAGYVDWQFDCTSPRPGVCDTATSSLQFHGPTLPVHQTGQGTVSTATTATAEQPIATTVQGPAGMDISISQGVAWPWLAPDHLILGQAIDIGLSLDNWEPSVDNPIILTFRLHASLLEAANLQSGEVTVLRDGAPAGDCIGESGQAVPDPCIATRERVGDELVLVVLSSHASTWLLAGTPQAVNYVFEGFLDPVANPGSEHVRNVVKAGQAVPLRWRLTDADGEPVLGLDSATLSVGDYDCGLSTTADGLSEAASGKSGLRSLGDGYYQFNWSTPKSYAHSCKELTVSIEVDGQSITASALFEFRK